MLHAQGQPGAQQGTINVHVAPSNELNTQFVVHSPELEELEELDEMLLLLDELDDEQQGQSEYVVVVGMG